MSRLVDFTCPICRKVGTLDSVDGSLDEQESTQQFWILSPRTYSDEPEGNFRCCKCGYRIHATAAQYWKLYL